MQLPPLRLKLSKGTSSYFFIVPMDFVKQGLFSEGKRYELIFREAD